MAMIAITSAIVLLTIWTIVFAAELYFWSRGRSIWDDFAGQEPEESHAKEQCEVSGWSRRFLTIGLFVAFFPVLAMGVILFLPPTWAVKQMARLVGGDR